MNSMPQHAVTNGYRNIEYLRPQLSTASTVVVMNESPPWRRNSSARASWTRFASSRGTGLGIARRIESTGIACVPAPERWFASAAGWWANEDVCRPHQKDDSASGMFGRSQNGEPRRGHE